MSKRCNHDCFNCIYSDCQNDVITREERREIRERDISFTNYGFILKQKPTRAKHRGRR